jgi:hypothetical protein
MVALLVVSLPGFRATGLRVAEPWTDACVCYILHLPCTVHVLDTFEMCAQAALCEHTCSCIGPLGTSGSGGIRAERADACCTAIAKKAELQEKLS